MSTNEPVAATIPHEGSVPPPGTAYETAPATSPAASKPDPTPTSTADSEATGTNPPAAPSAGTIPASPPSNVNMTHAQDANTPSLPERPGLPEPEAGPTVNSAPTVNPDHLNEDPQVASLHAIFPDFDSALLQSVLESVDGNQDRAIDMLLGMSDPNYTSQAPPAPVQSQTELDEEFARRLMLEEQNEQQQRQQSWNPQQYEGSAPYQPRVRPGRSHGSDTQGAPEQKDSMAEIQDQFSKIADTGKKTFNSLFTKVKAKMQEYDQQRTGQSSAQSGTQPSWGSGEQSYHQPQQAESPYYDATSRRQEAAAPYDAAPIIRDPRPVTSPPIATPPISQTPTTAPGVASSPPPPVASQGVDTPRPPSTSSGAPQIDPSKLGMLPKRPVSLLRDPSDPAPKRDDDDELEYAENPFEEHK